MATVSQAVPSVFGPYDYDAPGEAGPVVLPCEGWDSDDLDPAGESWETWTDEMDSAWTLGPDPSLADVEGLTLDGLVAVQIGRFRQLDTDAGDLMAETLAELASDLVVTGATTPAQLRDRREALQLTMAERMAQSRWPYDFEGWVAPAAV